MISDFQKENLQRIRNGLKLLESELVSREFAYHFIETRDSPDSTLQVNANTEGMIRIAMEALDLALSEFEGRHAHFDEASVLDHCDRAFVLSFKLAEWDKAESADTNK